MHDTRAKLGLDETREMHLAVKRALQLVDTRETLVVATADHSHALSFIGYPYRNESITGARAVLATALRSMSALGRAL